MTQLFYDNIILAQITDAINSNPLLKDVKQVINTGEDVVGADPETGISQLDKGQDPFAQQILGNETDARYAVAGIGLSDADYENARNTLAANHMTPTEIPPFIVFLAHTAVDCSVSFNIILQLAEAMFIRSGYNKDRVMARLQPIVEWQTKYPEINLIATALSAASGQPFRAQLYSQRMNIALMEGTTLRDTNTLGDVVSGIILPTSSIGDAAMQYQKGKKDVLTVQQNFAIEIQEVLALAGAKRLQAVKEHIQYFMKAFPQLMNSAAGRTALQLAETIASASETYHTLVNTIGVGSKNKGTLGRSVPMPPVAGRPMGAHIVKKRFITAQTTPVPTTPAPSAYSTAPAAPAAGTAVDNANVHKLQPNAAPVGAESQINPNNVNAKINTYVNHNKIFTEAYNALLKQVQDSSLGFSLEGGIGSPSITPAKAQSQIAKLYEQCNALMQNFAEYISALKFQEQMSAQGNTQAVNNQAINPDPNRASVDQSYQWAAFRTEDTQNIEYTSLVAKSKSLVALSIAMPTMIELEMVKNQYIGQYAELESSMVTIGQLSQSSSADYPEQVHALINILNYMSGQYKKVMQAFYYVYSNSSDPLMQQTAQACFSNFKALMNITEAKAKNMGFGIITDNFGQQYDPRGALMSAKMSDTKDKMTRMADTPPRFKRAQTEEKPDEEKNNPDDMNKEADATFRSYWDNLYKGTPGSPAWGTYVDKQPAHRNILPEQEKATASKSKPKVRVTRFRKH